MATDGERNTSRTAVRTYVPAYQRDTWDEHAAELDMSRSEYVRTMVQAGRRGFDEFAGAVEPPETEETSPDAEGGERHPGEGAESPAGSQGASPANGVEETVTELLADECLDWDELFDAITGDLEEQLESALEELQAENRVQYSGRKGGYVLVE